MLTNEQEKALTKACELYRQARQETNKEVAVELFNKAWDILIEHIDDVDDIYYRLVFANCVEELQRKWDVNLNSLFIKFKTDVYLKTLNWILDTTEYNTNFQGHFYVAFDALARLFLLGEDNVAQNNHYAYVCYQCLKMLGMPMVDELYLQDFIQDGSTGLYKFIGVRPQ